MDLLLNSNHQIKIEIIRYLNKIECKSIGLDALAQTSGLSLKTLRKYLNELCSEFVDFIEYDDINRTVIVKSYSTRFENEALRSYLKSSTVISILLDIALFPDKTHLERTLHLSISSSTYQRGCSKITAFLNDYGIFLKKRERSYSIVGDSENFVCKFLTCLYLEVYGFNFSGSLISLPELDTLIISCLRSNSIYIDELTTVYTLTYALLYLNRNSNRNFVCDSTINFDIRTVELIEAYSLKNKLSNKYKLILESTIQNIIINSSSNLNFTNYMSYIDFEEEINCNFHNLLSKQEIETMYTLFQTLYCSYSTSPYKTSVFINRVNDFVKNFKINHEGLFAAFEKTISKAANNQLIADLILNDFIYWSITNNYHLLNLTRSKLKLLIISDLGESHLKFLHLMLKGKLKHAQHIHVEINRYNVNTSIKIEDFDLILTNTMSIMGDNIVLIDDFPNPVQISNINNRIINIFENSFVI